MARKTDIIDLTKLKPRSHDRFDGLVWDRFDKIFCFHYLPYKERFANIQSELDRVGILNLPQFEWVFTVGNPFYSEVLNNRNVDSRFVGKHNINYTIDSLNLMIRCHEQRFNNVLIIEDDLKFIDNVMMVEKCVKSIPEDFDFVNLDPWYWADNGDNKIVEEQLEHLKELNRSGVMFEKFNELKNGLHVFQTSFVALSDRMIYHIIQNDFVQLKPFDHYCVNQNTSDEDFNRYVSTINLGYQMYYENAQQPMKRRYGRN